MDAGASNFDPLVQQWKIQGDPFPLHHLLGCLHGAATDGEVHHCAGETQAGRHPAATIRSLRELLRSELELCGDTVPFPLVVDPKLGGVLGDQKMGFFGVRDHSLQGGCDRPNDLGIQLVDAFSLTDFNGDPSVLGHRCTRLTWQHQGHARLVFKGQPRAHVDHNVPV